MKSDFKFSNLLGTVYKQGNLVFSNDGTQLLSPVGNRVTCFDLIKNKSFTFNFEHRKNISNICLNKQENLLISVDIDGRAILTNYITRKVLYHFNFKDRVRDISFSANGHFFAVACGRFIQVWKTPEFLDERQFFPFVRYRVYAGHFSDVTSITWSSDSRFFISTSKDMTSRIWSILSEEKDAAMVLAGHRDSVVRAFFNATQDIIYTVSKDGALFQWEYTTKLSNSGSNLENEEMEQEEEENGEQGASWRITAKNFFYAHANLSAAAFYTKSNLLVVGFSNGEFRIYELPEFAMIQQLSMGQNPINTVNINSSGEWLAFGSSKHGQLLVYEWQSESYVLKQQGHFDSLNTTCYSPDGSRIVTASDDGRIKVWDAVSGFCLMTFQEHTAAVTALQFAKKGQVLFSASLDGTLRAYDLIRFRNFRTFTGTNRIQFSSMAVDPSGEIIVAGSQDSFEIFVWSVQTGQLLDSLTGHEGPISFLAFGKESSVLASASWDKTIRIWSIFGRSQQVEPIETLSDVLSLALRPDSKEVAVSTLDGHIITFDVEEGRQARLIDCKRDILAGRFLEDRFTAKNLARAKYFTTISYSFDGTAIVAGGNNNSICLYDLNNEVLLRRFIVSQNMQFNGTLEILNSRNMGESGPLDLIDRDGENSDLEDRLDNSLPGSHRGDPTLRKVIPEIRVTSIAFSPTLSAFVAASTEGVLIYSVDTTMVFDPYELDIDITPQSMIGALKDKEYLTALIMAFRLNEQHLIRRAIEEIPVRNIQLIASDLPVVYLERFLSFVGELASDSPHMEFLLLWTKSLLSAHGQFIAANKADFAVPLRLIRRFLERRAHDVVELTKSSGYSYTYLKLAPNEEPQAQNQSSTYSSTDGSDAPSVILSDDDASIATSSDLEEDWIRPQPKATKVMFSNENMSQDNVTID